MFWSCKVETGKRYGQEVEAPYHLTMAALVPDESKKGNVSIMVDVDGTEVLLATLKHNHLMQVQLDHMFGEGQNVVYFINGDGAVSLSGYIMPEEDEFPFGDMDEEGESDGVSEDVSDDDAAEAVAGKRKKVAAIENGAKKPKVEVQAKNTPAKKAEAPAAKKAETPAAKKAETPAAKKAETPAAKKAEKQDKTPAKPQNGKAKAGGDDEDSDDEEMSFDDEELDDSDADSDENESEDLGKLLSSIKKAQPKNLAGGDQKAGKTHESGKKPFGGKPNQGGKSPNQQGGKFQNKNQSPKFGGGGNNRSFNKQGGGFQKGGQRGGSGQKPWSGKKNFGPKN
ncbi:46 kDa FK506-binding nuclear protein [Halotydeus destructor]|nr:46 kDa FK506-binding nuclear protein [Halotydeus destructor]